MKLNKKESCSLSIEKCMCILKKYDGGTWIGMGWISIISIALIKKHEKKFDTFPSYSILVVSIV
jgi:hypothetical protein